ncbi:Heat shock 70 kDa protein 6 [Diaporthe eres]|uniref:Heat shock 70 kDa protein 6 n=1 Tax=Diaporthe eres TaxID=83184 RepID=A0ABR1PC66_DIAER
MAVQEMIKSLHYRVEGKEDKPVIKVDIKGQENTFTPEQIAGVLMAKLGNTAAETIDDYMRCAVVAVPSNFNENQRQAVKDAGDTVGLNVIRIINEPTAVAIAYGLDRLDDEQNVLVLDMGASTTDVTMLYIDQGVVEILAAASTPTSGRLFNRRLVH